MESNSGLHISCVMPWIERGMVFFQSLKWGTEDPGDVSWMLDVRKQRVLSLASPASFLTI